MAGTEDAQKFHSQLDELVHAIEQKFFVVTGAPEGLLPSFSMPDKRDDKYAIKAFPASAHELTGALDSAEVSYLAENLLLGSRRITIPYIDDALGEKLEAAITHFKTPSVEQESDTHIHGGPAERSKGR